MKLAIVGSRTFNDYEKLKETLTNVKSKIDYEEIIKKEVLKK